MEFITSKRRDSPDEAEKARQSKARTLGRSQSMMSFAMKSQNDGGGTRFQRADLEADDLDRLSQIARGIRDEMKSASTSSVVKKSMR